MKHKLLRCLTIDQCFEIREKYLADGGPLVMQLAREYGVSKSTITSVVNNHVRFERLLEEREEQIKLKERK